MFDAWSPLGPVVLSKVTFWFSLSDLNPLPWIAEKCENKSLPPSSGVMKPKPFASLNHLTVPAAIFTFLDRLKSKPIGREKRPAASQRSRDVNLRKPDALLPLKPSNMLEKTGGIQRLKRKRSGVYSLLSVASRATFTAGGRAAGRPANPRASCAALPIKPLPAATCARSPEQPASSCTKRPPCRGDQGSRPTHGDNGSAGATAAHSRPW